MEHSEELEHQEQSVAYFESLRNAAPASRKTAYESYAIRHRDIIARFNRFPHLNSILGRGASPEEIAFLEEPETSFL